jgi:hypothetical protein
MIHEVHAPYPDDATLRMVRPLAIKVPYRFDAE